MTISVPLLSTEDLDLHLHDDDLLACDCRFAGDADASRAIYTQGHIPGAIHVYWLEDLSAADTAVTTLLPNEHEAAEKVGRLGISSDTSVVAYSDNGNLYASRLWHVLTHYGHERVALLDGGIEKWQREGRPLEQGAVSCLPGRFAPRSSPSPAGVGAAEIAARLDDPGFCVVDVRGAGEFSGETRRAARGGHIPGAVLWPWEKNLCPDGTLRDPAEIRARALQAGFLPEQEIVTYCQGGVRAAHAALALALAGFERVRIYDGSWAEWGNDPARPVECAVAAPAR